jgi:hypothetical protein
MTRAETSTVPAAHGSASQESHGRPGGRAGDRTGEADAAVQPLAEVSDADGGGDAEVFAQSAAPVTAGIGSVGSPRDSTGTRRAEATPRAQTRWRAPAEPLRRSAAAQAAVARTKVALRATEQRVIIAGSEGRRWLSEASIIGLPSGPAR